MKTLLIIRHAKAETVFSHNDFERPLNERGKKDAPEMARRLLKKNIRINAFISSPARRAKKTAQLFAEVYGCTEEDIILVSALYQAQEETFKEVVAELNDNLDSVAIFAHNPGITHFANSLTAVNLDNMPTCSIFGVECNLSRWVDFGKAKKEFLFFDYPKNMG